jgi:hypothetical protein
MELSNGYRTLRDGLVSLEAKVRLNGRGKKTCCDKNRQKPMRNEESRGTHTRAAFTRSRSFVYVPAYIAGIPLRSLPQIPVWFFSSGPKQSSYRPAAATISEEPESGILYHPTGSLIEARKDSWPADLWIFIGLSLRT